MTTGPANRLLADLPAAEYARLLPRLERVDARMGQVLYDAGQPITHVYFPLSGMYSLVLALSDRTVAEVGAIGAEGLVGLPAFLGAERSPTRALCQIPGACLRMPAALFRRLAGRGGRLHDAVQRYTQGMVNQLSQSVACNGRHAVGPRCARWLLMCHDRAGADEFPLTHDFLGQMLGVRRPAVTVAAGVHQAAGRIDYTRGRVRVRDRAGLEAAACECYGVVRAEFARLFPAPTDR